MENWQKEHIKDNPEALAENLKCSSILIKYLLKTGDLDKSEFKATKIKEESFRLYKTLQFSAKGYETLLRAAYECKQTEILKILLNGFRKQEIKNPLTQCRIPISISAIQSTEIWIKGCKLKVEDVFAETDLSTLEEIIKKYHLEDDYIDTFTTGDKKLELAATIPAEPPFYIPRLVSNRLKLKPEVFEENVEDLFLFKGLKHYYELTNVANKNRTTTFSTIIRNKEMNKIIRFIWLEDNNENIWNEILKYSGETPVHLVKVEIKGDGGLRDIKDGQYILEATNNFQSIQEWVAKQPKEMAAYIPENNFVSKIISNNGNPGFCICDTPGMGKSFLLASLARKVQELNSDWVVLYAKITDFIEKLKEQKHRLRGNPELSPNLTLEHFTSSQILVKLLVQAFTRGSKRLELFLDGLDELTSEEDLKLMKMFLKAIIKFQTGRGNVYVTARSHVQADLEKTLEVAAYDILPFSPENQVEFLKKSWMEKWKVKDEKKSELLEGLAKRCLETIEKTFSAQGKEIMGIPLQCFLLAGIHEDDANRVLRNEILVEDTIIQNYSFYDLLEKYIDTRKSSRSDCNWEEVKNLHIWKALARQVGVECASDYARFKELKTELHEKYCSYGILTMSVHGPMFIHQTFIEFFVVLCFGELIKSVNSVHESDLLERMIRHLAKNIVFRRSAPENTNFPDIYPSYFPSLRVCIRLQTFTFPNQVHLYFFNKYLCNNYDSIYPLTSNELLARSLRFIYEEAYRVLQCCFHSNHVYILRFIKNLFQNGWKHLKYKSLAEPSMKLFRFSRSTEQSPIVRLILMAARTSSVDITMELEELLESCKCDQSQVEFPICENFKITPLQIAAESGNNEVFLHHLKNYSYKPEELLLWCTNNSLESESSAVKGKQEICELLISDMSHSSRDDFNLVLENAIYEENVHSDLISFLVDKFKLDNSKPNVKRSQYIWHLQSNSKEEAIVTKLVKNILCQYRYAAHIDDSLLRRILESSAFSVKLINERFCKEEESYGDNLLLALVRKKRSRVVLEALGNDKHFYKFKNKKEQNALHVAAARYGKVDVDVIGYLYSKGVSLEEYDSEGNTPLLLANRNLEMIECFLKVKANVSAINTENKKNLLHLMATYYYQDEDNIDNHLRVVKDLIDRGIDVNAKDSEERFPLLSYLLSSYRSPSYYKEIADLLLDHGADINAVDNEGNNLLFWGTYEKKNPHVLEYLEDKGVKWKDISNKSNDTIFHMAAKGGSIDFLKYILEQPNCGDINAKNNEGKTPLLSALACKKGSNIVIEMVNLFASKNADFSAVDKKGNNAIFLAAYHRQCVDVLKLLEEKNVDWKSRNENGDCILHMAAKYDLGLNYFLSKPDCPDVNERNKEGKTPLLSAFTKTSDDLMEMKFHARYVKDIIGLLRGNGNLDINAVDKDGNNALHLALNSGMPARIIENLKALGCNPDMPNNRGQTFNQLFNISKKSESFRRDREMLDSSYESYIGERERRESESFRRDRDMLDSSYESYIGIRERRDRRW